MTLMLGAARPRRYAWVTAIVTAAALVVVVAAAWSARSAHSSAQAIRPLPQSRTSPGAHEASLVVTVRIGADGSLAVTEQLSDPPAGKSVVFWAPPSVEGAGIPTGQQAHPRVSELTGSVDGRIMSPVPSGVQRWTIARIANGAQVVAVAYRVNGVVVRSTPAPAGRAIEVITPLLLGAATPARVQVTVTAAAPVTILGLNCPRARPANVVCGQQVGEQWEATFGPGVSTNAQLLTAQVNLQR